MSRCDVCPEQLMRFVRGQLAEPDISHMERHLESCAECSETLADLRLNDSDLLGSLTTVANQGEEADRQLVGQLVEQISDWRPGLAWNETTRWGSRAEPRSRQDLQTALQRILQPAQQPDELGRLGPFVLRRILGVGGMGIVCEADDPTLKRRVAIKILKPELAEISTARKRFLQEAQAAAAIEHHNVVAIHLVGEDGGVPYFAMPLLAGVTLQEYVDSRGPLPNRTVLSIARQIAVGLAAAHQQGLIHQDIKPANIFVVQDKSEGPAPGSKPSRRPPQVKLLDFGLARAATADSRTVDPDTFAGTPSYMSPEQAEGATLDHRSDLFSLGCVLYWMSTGQSPFGGRNKRASLQAVSQYNPPLPSTVNAGVSESVTAIIMKLLEKQPDRRFQSADELIAALDSASATEEAVHKPPVRPWIPIATVLAAIILLGTILYVMTSKGTLVLEVNEPDVKVSLDGARVQIQSPRDQIELTVGDHDLEVTKDGFTSYTKRFHIRRGERVELTARLESSSAPRTPEPAAIEPTEVTIEVPANRQWTATGIKLRFNMAVRIVSSGMVDAAPETDTREYYQEVPAAGRQERLPHFPEPALPGLCLMGRIGNGRAFYVGDDLSLIVTPVDASGELYLGINDDLVDDNFGAWKVTIRINSVNSK